VLLSETHFPCLGQDAVFADAVERVAAQGFFGNVELPRSRMPGSGDAPAPPWRRRTWG
jgi:hypothetical protein